MKNKDWLVTDDGSFVLCQSARKWDLLQENYRLYRFLTELEDILKGASQNIDVEVSYLPNIRMLVRKLILNSYWVRSRFSLPNPQTGVSVEILYDELGFPFTFQTVSFAPGTKSTIHNHGTWGVVAILQGEEKNLLWRSKTPVEIANTGKCVEQTGEIILNTGDMISFTPGAIHSVEALGEKPTVTLNLYGETDPKRRFEYDLEQGKVVRF
ncbi:cupin [Calothrix sp. NIES-3974]|uniref:cysteine dioxygenase family protein n=1 Tax=Calothrix sp. NIES-3974 TaxID=2005462 RepID=UPI000B5EB56B|nr:cupin [Calothrix sp. NIES-3974]BAZ06615.1 cupin domain-containing protein [Calothrix sp. NIES-3974]